VKLSSRPASSLDLLPVRSVDGNTVHLAGGGARAVLECPPLAFSLRGEVEQQALVEGWSDLLNSITHPIQVLVRTRPLESLTDREAPLNVASRGGARLRRSYLGLLRDLSAGRRLVSRHHYLVVPCDPAPIEPDSWLGRLREVGLNRLRPATAAASPEVLAERVRWATDSLQRIGIAAVRLESLELGRLLHSVMVGDLAARQPLAPTMEGLGLAELAAPAAVSEAPSRLAVGERFARTLAVTAYPRLLRPAWLESLLQFEGDLDLSLHIQPSPTERVMPFLERRIAELASTVRVAEEAGRRPDVFRRAALDDADALQERLARGEEKLFSASLYATLWADSIDGLDAATRRFEAILGSNLIQSRRLLFQMLPGLLSTLPIGVDQVGIARNLPTRALAVTFPFSGVDLADGKGLLYGLNSEARSPVILDRFALENHNAVVFATSGAGKSYLVKVELIRAHLAGIQVQVIDPEGEYAAIVESLGGRSVAVRPGLPIGIDPFDIDSPDPGALASRIATVVAFTELLCGGLSPLQTAAVEDAVSFAYATQGFTHDGRNDRLAPPSMADVVGALDRRNRSASSHEIQELTLKLERYLRGSGSWLLARGAKRTVAEPTTVAYVMAGVPEEHRAAAMFLVLDRIWSDLRQGGRPSLVVLDEAWWLMQYPDTARFVRQLAKTARKRGAGLTLVTQDVVDVLQNPLGVPVISNAAVQILMKQAPQAIPGLADLFRLSPTEQSWLINARQGEGLILAGGKRVPFRVIASREEKRLIEGGASGRRAA
jgi:hypothetical protein